MTMLIVEVACLLVAVCQVLEAPSAITWTCLGGVAAFTAMTAYFVWASHA